MKKEFNSIINDRYMQRIIPLVIILFHLLIPVQAQPVNSGDNNVTATMLLNPPQGYNKSNQLTFKVFFRSSANIVLSWGKSFAAGTARLKIGKAPGNYTTKSISVSGNSITFTPSSAQLPVGRYYALITTSSRNTLSEIQSDFAGNPTIEFSNEIQFIVESAVAPQTLAPKGNITNSVPTFEWTPVPGVPAYWLILSSTPFQIITLDNGDLSIQGADIIWNYITDGTSAQYGELSPNSPYSSEAPPLLPNNEFNYTLLNLYDLNDVSSASGVFSGVTSFTYTTVEQIKPPNLVSPVNEKVFYGDENINFKWDPVAGANGYNIQILNRVSSFAGNEQQLDLPIWNSFTNSTSINFPARTTLSKGNYLWYVIANDNSGSGNISKKNKFTYNVNISTFTIHGYNTTNGANLLSFEVKARSISKGVSPANPFLITNSTSFVDSLVTGTYEFTAKKDGFYDSTFVYQLVSGQNTNVNIYLRPIPAIVSGVVQDNNSQLLSNADVSFKNISSGNVIRAKTNLQGAYSKFMPKGSYKVEASKPGYKTSESVTITVTNNQLVLGTISLKKDVVTYAGKVFNDEQKSIKQALVKATSGNVIQQLNTDESGNFSFSLSSGQWVVETSKSGFVSPGAKAFNFAAGDVYQNQVITMAPKANQLSGFVYRVVSTGGTTGYVPFPDVTVTAKPQAGSAVSTTTNINGQFSLSLKSGSYTIEAVKSNYTSDKSLSLSLGVGETLSGISFNLTPNKSSVSGIIKKSDGAGLSGVKITTKAGESTESLPNGSYTLSVAAGTKTISVSKSGYVSPDPAVINVAAGQNLGNINFNMIANAGSISGKITSLQNVLADAEVTAVSSTSSTTTSSDQFGNFVLNLKPGTYSLSAVKNGFLKSSTKSVTIGPGQQSTNNNFDLIQNTAKISGSVQSNNSPLANARVELKDNSGTKVYVLSTSVYGSYSASVEAGLTYSVSVSLSGYIKKSFNTENLSAGGNYTYNVALDAAQATISGFVYNQSSEVLSNAVINISNQDNGQSLLLNPGSDGSYSTGLPAGNYNVKCSAEGHYSDSLSLTLNRGQKSSDINFNLTENYAVISGTIKDQSGDPVESAIVSVSSANQTANAVSGTDGAYFISGLTGGNYAVQVIKENYSIRTIDNMPINKGDSKIIDFSLELQIGHVHGFILDNTEQALEGASILLLSDGGTQYSTQTDNQGYYEFVSLPLGNYNLDVINTGYAAIDAVSIVLQENDFEKEVSLNNLQTLNAVVAGNVKDETGISLEGVSINLSGDSGSGSAVTNTAGDFSIENLLAADYNLQATLEGYAVLDTTIRANGGNSLNLVMVKNTSNISGTVKNQLGNNLSFLVNVNAVAGNGEIYNTQTNSDGNFSFSNVANNTDYTLYTDIYKQGYTNDTTTFNLGLGVQNYPNVALTVTVSNSRISGNVGVDQVSLNLLNNSSGSQTTIFSGSSGDFEFTYLSNGSYTLTPKLTGYTFSPSTWQSSLGARDTVTADFTASKNSGAILATVKDNNGLLIEGVEINALSSDGLLNFTGSTDSIGLALLENIPAGSYEVRASKEGYSSTQASRTVSVSVNSQATTEFTLRKNTSSISGFVKLVDNNNSTPVPNASVQLNYQSGAAYTATSGNDGSYEFNSLPSGSVNLKASGSGSSSDVVSFQLADDENKTGVDLQITASVVEITGKVIYDGSGVEGVTIEALSSSSFQVVTNSNGVFKFDNVPIKRGETDTTSFLVRINDENYPSKQSSIRIPSSSKGSTISIPDFILPSGQISILITDGNIPLSGVNLNFAEPNGDVTSIYTDDTGLFTSARLLSAGTYNVTLSKEQYLIPGSSATRVILPDDTTSYDLEISLPFIVNSVDSVFADTPTEIQIVSNVAVAGYSGILYYKSISASNYQAIAFSAQGNGFNATIPALFSTEELQYYIVLKRTNDGLAYTSENFTVTSYARGLLTSFEVSPAIGNQIVRMGDSYTLQVTLRDGLNKSINDNFIGSQSTGTLEWVNNNSDILEITFPDNLNPTHAVMNIKAAGQASISLQASSTGKSIVREIALTASDIPLKNIIVNSPSTKLSNKSDGIQFSYSAVDTLNRAVLLGDGLDWGVIPVDAGSITEEGVYIPVDSTYIGTSLITLYDDISELTGTKELSVYARVDKNSIFSLTDKKGMFLTIPKGAVEDPIEVSVGTAQFGPAKKHFTSLENNKTYTVSDDVYNIIYTGNSLPGDSLLIPASFELPSSESLEFFEGQKLIAVYDPVEKQWITIPENSQLQKAVLSSGFYRFGEYSILSENEPLGIRYLSVLPSPFSPVVGPVKIGYFLTTSYPPAVVTIKIYNMRGELIRTLLDNDIQYPGKYGSRSSQKEIYWDGLTDNNYMARNGRYIIQVSVQDQEDEINKLIQVVLIK